MTDACSRLNSVAFLPFSPGELTAFRRLARRPVDFGALALAVERLQILRTLRPEDLDHEASLGAERAEVAAVTALAQQPAPDEEALRLKTDLLATAVRGGSGNLAEMLSAAVSSDAARLARAAADVRRCPTGASDVRSTADLGVRGPSASAPQGIQASKALDGSAICTGSNAQGSRGAAPT